MNIFMACKIKSVLSACAQTVLTFIAFLFKEYHIGNGGNKLFVFVFVFVVKLILSFRFLF
jgi:hypothetical protein